MNDGISMDSEIPLIPRGPINGNLKERQMSIRVAMIKIFSGEYAFQPVSGYQ
jgi:hypothetical protein